MTQMSETQDGETVRVMDTQGETEIGTVYFDVDEEHEGIALLEVNDEDGSAWLPLNAAELDELIAAAQRICARLA